MNEFRNAVRAFRLSSKPAEKRVLFVAPQYYQMAMTAARDKVTGFERRGRWFYLLGARIITPHKNMETLIKYRRDLWKLFPDVTECVAVELGAAEGLHSRDLCANGYKLVITVDAWETMPHLKGDASSPQSWHDSNYKNACDLLRPFGGRSKILRGPTTQMAQYVADESVDLVYIDADHSYEGVKNDIKAWWPKLKRGGVCAFHDYEMTQYGVKPAVQEFARTINSVDGIYIINLLPEDAIKDAGAYIVKA